uniref:Uncharacterized protein MANES_06G172200 n=1 Tax=Rhizophora mucronata TaxID=61149 RepID=A0A2P2JCI0_RHIMU
MAVEARHSNPFPPQLLGYREMMNDPMEGNASVFNTLIGYGVPLSGTTTTTEALLPNMYNSSVIADSIPQKAQIKSESCLTYNLAAAAAAPVLVPSRKRPRESFNPLFLSYPMPPSNKNNYNNTNGNPFSFLGEDLSALVQHEQFDLDRLISQHVEKVRMEMEEKRKRQARRIIDAIGERIMKRLKAKEEEIEKIGKLNWALEEKINSLCIENQLWRDLAQTYEATANALRSNLQQVLAAADQRTRLGLADETDAAAVAMMDDDAQSCCGSSSSGDGQGPYTLARESDVGKSSSSSRSKSLCRNCRREESCVLLLPCRHLCLCTACGSSLRACPICKSTMDDSFHVNMS